MKAQEDNQSTKTLSADSSKELLEKELYELEDSYAECLADNVDPKTLTTLWLRIKSIRKLLATD